ncbi:MAG: 50S ribosomal protein L15 [Planctomycetes bacterium]|nr:50S ribosomal protein L15 [Planctomycetota bacterium]
MIINDVHRGIEKRKNRKRVGRGLGSGHGKTAGRGDKGHSAHPGHARRLGFEGGQKPLFRRLAKAGFSNNFFSKVVAVVNLSDLERGFEAGTVVDVAALEARGIVSGKYDVVKVLAKGELKKKLTVIAHEFSAAAIEKIQAAGGQAERIA